MSGAENCTKITSDYEYFNLFVKPKTTYHRNDKFFQLFMVKLIKLQLEVNYEISKILI